SRAACAPPAPCAAASRTISRRGPSSCRWSLQGGEAMLAIFCLRMACGLVGALLLLSPAQINPRFFRTHFLTALGLCALAALFLGETADNWLWVALGSAMLLSFLGSVAWHVEGAPGGRTL